MPAAQTSTFNPLIGLLYDAITSCSTILHHKKDWPITPRFVTRSSGLHSIMALHSFLNNLLQTEECELSGNVVDKIDRLFAIKRGVGLPDEIKLLFTELNEVEKMLLNPTVLTPFRTDGKATNIDFDYRTPVFKMIAGSDTFALDYATISLGLTCLAINHVVDILSLNSVQVTRVFGVTIQTEDGFQDALAPAQVRGLLDKLEDFKNSHATDLVLYKGVQKEWFTFKFLEPLAGTPKT